MCVYLVNIPEPVLYEIYTQDFSFDLRCESVTLYSCNMGMSGLPGIYTQSTRAAGSRAEGVYIRQIMSAHVTTVMYHLFIGQKPT